MVQPRIHSTAITTIADIAAHLDGFLESARYPEETNGVFHPSSRPIRRLGLVLEPWPGLVDWAERQQVDALFLHRPWKLAPTALSPNVGIVSYHLAFDEHLTLGFNKRLADALGLSSCEVLGEKEGRPLGMIGAVPPQAPESLLRQCRQTFGGEEDVWPAAQETIAQVAVVGAMNDDLVREAARRGAGLYITGQFRQPGRQAVLETGVGVLAVGHRRSEEWGLRALAGVLRERWIGLDVRSAPQS